MSRLCNRLHGVLRMHPDEPEKSCTFADPEWEGLHKAMHTARYDLARLTQSQVYAILHAAECYVHLLTHPVGTEACVRRLRELRRALRESDDE